MPCPRFGLAGIAPPIEDHRPDPAPWVEVKVDLDRCRAEMEARGDVGLRVDPLGPARRTKAQVKS